MGLCKKLLLLPGDGIGPEVMAEARKIIMWMNESMNHSFEVEEALVGGAAYDAHGTSLTDNVMASAMDADAILFGAVGGPKWEHVERDQRPEAGLLRLRKEMDLYANLRPAIVFDTLKDASTLKADVVAGLDLMIIRELTAGVYFGTPRGIELGAEGIRKGFDTEVYTETEIIRVSRIAFELARKRANKVHSVEKANVMESGIFWREIVTKLHADEYSDIELLHMYADNCAMQLVRNPKQFDVIVTNNLFGDILSDCAAMLTGSLGMLPSASLGASNQSGHRRALYEPVHGSAPDIAGQNMANPIAMVLSLAMMLRYSFDLSDEANVIEQAISNVLASGLRTADLAQTRDNPVKTSEMGSAILKELVSITT